MLWFFLNPCYGFPTRISLEDNHSSGYSVRYARRLLPYRERGSVYAAHRGLLQKHKHYLILASLVVHA